MSDQNTVFFGMNAGSTSSAEASYPFSKIISSDKSISVGNTNGHTDLTVSIKAGGSVSAILNFTLDENLSHSLYCCSQSNGLVSVSGGNLNVLTLPPGASILVASGNGPYWLTVPSGPETRILGVNGGGFAWFEMADCEGACKEETQE